MRIIPYSKLDKLCNSIPAFKDYRLQVSLQVISMLLDKTLALQFHTAEQRYKNLLNKFPGILLRASSASSSGLLIVLYWIITMCGGCE